MDQRGKTRTGKKQKQKKKSRLGQEIFLFSKTSKPGLGPTQPPIKFVPAFLRYGIEVDHLPPSSAEVKNEWSYTSASPICLHDVDTDIFLKLNR
jgi:hypothetical protein